MNQQELNHHANQCNPVNHSRNLLTYLLILLVGFLGLIRAGIECSAVFLAEIK